MIEPARQPTPRIGCAFAVTPLAARPGRTKSVLYRNGLRQFRTPAQVLAKVASIALLCATIVNGDFARAQSAQQLQALRSINTLESGFPGIEEGRLRVVPLPIHNPTIKSGAALGVGYVFSLGSDTRRSYVALGGFGTSNHSRGGAIGATLNFADRWRIHLAVGKASVSYNLSLAGSSFSIPITQKGTVGEFIVAYQFSDAFTLSGRFGYTETILALNSAKLPPKLQGDFGVTTGVYEVIAHYDQRDNPVYPTKGYDLLFSAGWGRVVEGDPRSFSKSMAKAAIYHSVSPTSVLAVEATVCQVSDKTLFFLACALGGTDGLRGYIPSENIADALTSVQVEYRTRFSERFGAVVFAGAGRVGENLSELDTGPFSAAGFGLRYRVTKKLPLDLSFDISVNRDGDTYSYLYVGQRF